MAEDHFTSGWRTTLVSLQGPRQGCLQSRALPSVRHCCCYLQSCWWPLSCRCYQVAQLAGKPSSAGPVMSSSSSYAAQTSTASATRRCLRWLQIRDCQNFCHQQMLLPSDLQEAAAHVTVVGIPWQACVDLLHGMGRRSVCPGSSTWTSSVEPQPSRCTWG